MRKMPLVTMLLFCTMSLAHARTQNPQQQRLEYAQPDFWLGIAQHSTDFVNDHAFNAEQGFYYSELDQTGQVVSDKVYLIALSRMIYAQSFIAEQNLGDINRAKKATDFLVKQMLAEDELGPYFIAEYNVNEKRAAKANTLKVAEQAYGLNGLVEYYRVSQDKDLLVTIRRLYRAFFERFHDDSYGGFYDGYHLDTQTQIKTKSYNSTVYVATAFLINLMEVDIERQASYQTILKELMALAAQHFIDDSGWIVENFDRRWQPQWSDWQRQGQHTIGVVGHNLQYAWLMLRANRWSFISEQERQQYQYIATEVLEHMLDNASWDKELGGFHDAFQRETNQVMWNTNKAWWQQAEGILALDAALKSSHLSAKQRQKFAVAQRATIGFFKRYFVDEKHGGEFFNVTKTGVAIQNELKGQRGKSAYHTVELAKFMID